MYDVFLSYSKKDKNIAKIIALGLQNSGLEVWWDIEIRSGQTWDSAIETAINNCKCLVVLWTQNSIHSEWVRIEADEGKKRDILVPVLLDSIEIPLAFRRRQYYDLSTWSHDISSPSFLCLVEEIKTIIGHKKDLDEFKKSSLLNKKATKSKSRLKRIFATLLLVVVLASSIWYFTQEISDKSEHQKIESINFNVNSDSLALVFHSKTLMRKDTFFINSNQSVENLKKAIERHYNFTYPTEFAKNIENEGVLYSVLVGNGQVLQKESLSLLDAGLKNFDIIEFDYKKTIRD